MTEYITLYHGSPIENLESILENGIIPNPHSKNAEEKVLKAIFEISNKLNLEEKAIHDLLRCKDFSVRRLNEAKENGEVVYLSAQKEYAIANSLAGKEWLESLVRIALYWKYKRFYNAERRKWRRVHKIQETLEWLTKKTLQLYSLGKDEEALEFENKESLLEKKMWQIEKNFNRKWGYMYNKIKEERIGLIGNKAVIFEIRIPKEEFNELLSPLFKLKLTERTLSLEWISRLLEIHLKKVEPKYIVGYDIIVKEDKFPDTIHKVINHVELNPKENE